MRKDIALGIAHAAVQLESRHARVAFQRGQVTDGGEIAILASARAVHASEQVGCLVEEVCVLL